MRLVASILGLTTLAVAKPSPELERIYDEHRWFELRTAVSGAGDSFYAGAVAVAFNDWPEARRQLQAAIAARVPAHRIEDCYHLLVNACLRRGAYREAQSIAERGETEFSSLKELKPLLGALALSPEQTVVRRQPAHIPREMARDGLVVPLTINGETSTYVVDTGANFCVMTRSEAGRRKMQVVPVRGSVGNSAGQDLRLQVAVAQEVALGGFRMGNVAFLIFEDHDQPFNDMEPHSRGAIGIPLLLALGSFSWTRETLEIAAVKGGPEGGAPNLAFDGLFPVVRAMRENRPVAVVLDTGARATHLWEPLFSVFPKLREGAVKQVPKESHGVGGSVRLENVRIAEFTMSLGGRRVMLEPAYVYLSPTTGQSRYYQGNLGRDLLGQASRVSIDFDAMRITLE